MKETPRPVNLVRSEYQPSEAELEEAIDIRHADGRWPTPEELARATLRLVTVNWKHRPGRGAVSRLPPLEPVLAQDQNRR